MAQMIPEFYDDDTPLGEKLFFDWIANQCPPDWVAFHGLDLQAWNRSRKTEIDFLLVIPATGILCIEIKSHKKVEVRRGTWYLNQKPQKKAPLKQAEDAQKTFYRRKKDKLPDLTRIPSTRLVVFPRALVRSPDSIEYNQWEVWNQDDCLNSVANISFSKKLVHSLESAIKHEYVLRPLERPVSQKEINKLEQFLRPAFKSAPASIAEGRERQHRMENYLRAQQKPAMSLFESNKRLIVDGPAGTGKSLIALEVARREKDAGRRVGILCFNAPMAWKLKSETQRDQPLLIGGGIHARIAELLEITIPNFPDGDYWNGEFLDLAETKLMDDEIKADCQFDVLILDEAQDLLCRPRLLDIVESLLLGGFSDGSWLMAGDFQYQIFSSDEMRENVSNRVSQLRDIPRVSYYALDENCRNYRMVGDPALKLSSMEDRNVYSGFMRGDGSHKFFNPKSYVKEKQQVELLKNEIKRNINNGTDANDIVVLSFRRPDASAAHAIVGGDIAVRRIGQPGNGVQYGSIHEFKGLESKVVILIDVCEPTSQFERDLFYVGMTRAIYSVSVLVSNDHQAWFMNAIRGTSHE